jgi:ADP-ribosylglycohydrolase
MLGGDTDTNGAIVGGLIGALVGIHRIPENMIDKIFSFDNNGD